MASDFLSEVINKRIKPTPNYILSPIKENGKVIISVKVYSGAATPYYYDYDGLKEAFIRSGNEIIVAPNHILNELILKGNNQTYDSIITRYRKSDYSFLIFEAAFFDITKNRITHEDYRSLNLVDKNGFLTNAGVLLADQNIYRHSRIFCTHWNRINKTSLLGEAIDDKEISGCIINQLYSAIDFIKSNYKNQWKKSGIIRVENPDYHIDALREAIINAIIHREYTRLGVEISIDIYENRIEVTSPGGMITGKTIDKSIDKIIASERRNPVIADIFSRMKFMERRGSGLKKITEKTNLLFGDNDNHVEFYSDNDYFKVIIHNANYKNKELFNENSPIKLSKTENDIINLIIKDEHITRQNISIILKKDISTIKKAITRLKKVGYVYREGSKKNGKWIINEKN